MRKLNDFDFNGKKTIVRVDFNVPIVNGVITDDNRIKESLRTINYLIEKGAQNNFVCPIWEKQRLQRTLVKTTLETVAKRLSELINKNSCLC